MRQDKQDRRSQRTRQLVIASMMELMAEKSYDAITVQDLLDRANIGRSTFYSHYFDKEDVLTSLAEQMLELLRKPLSQRDVGQGIIPSLELFQHALQHHQHFRAMLRGHAREVVWDAAQTTLCRAIEQTLAATFAQNTLPQSLCRSYLSTWLGPFSTCSNGGWRPRCPIHQRRWMKCFSKWHCLEYGQPLRGRGLLHREMFSNLVAHPVGLDLARL